MKRSDTQFIKGVLAMILALSMWEIKEHWTVHVILLVGTFLLCHAALLEWKGN